MSSVPMLLFSDLNRLREDSHGERAWQDSAEIEELISKAVHLFSRLNRQHERWASRIREGLVPFIMEEAKPWQAAFQQWADDARRIIREARGLEDRGVFLEQLDILRSSLAHCPYDGMDMERLLRNAEAHAAGRGVPAGEIRDAIQRRLRT
jgi:hypothetical protein